MGYEKGLVGCIIEAIDLISETTDIEVGIFFDKTENSYQLVVDAKLQFIKRVEQFERFKLVMILDYKLVEALVSVDWSGVDRFERWINNLRKE